MVYEAPPLNTYWKCERCTACCRWPGDVKISSPEITQIAHFLLLSQTDFL